MVGLAALHILWFDLGEIRSLAVRRDLHGTGFLFNRNEFFNANDFFRNKSADPRLSSTPALYRFNTFGGTIGGPIPLPKINTHRDNLFFFYSLDATRSRLPSSLTGGISRFRMPTSLERQGKVVRMRAE